MAEKENQNISQKEHFNYLRNNSSKVYDIFTWGIPDNRNQTAQTYIDLKKNQNLSLKASVDQTEMINEKKGKISQNNKMIEVSHTRASSENRQNKKKNDKKLKGESIKYQPKPFERQSKLVKNIAEEKREAQWRKQKVQKYIEEQRPFSRGMSNSKFQQYYNKPAPQCYGRCNTTQPAGGIIYGNYMKTHSITPHSYTNKPQFYQTHTTALNFGKRTKLNDEQRLKKLERELSKKLGLKQKNQTLKQGKSIVYSQINEQNMERAFQYNHEFHKKNRNKIRAKELEYKKEKHKQYLDDINEFYEKKEERITQNLVNKGKQNKQGNLKDTNVTQTQMKGEDNRLTEQVVYKFKGKNEKVRFGTDRHSMTCFVDTNFPENQQIYVETLKERLQIHPKKAGQDGNIDEIRRQNYWKAKQQPYPIFYLVRGCEEPEVLKMISEKTNNEPQQVKTRYIKQKQNVFLIDF